MSESSPTPQDLIGCHSKKRDVSEAPSASLNKRAKTTDVSNPSLEDPGVWKPLALSGFLRSPDLGRLLVMTKKNWNVQTEEDQDANEDDDVWKYLCRNHWGSDTANTLLQATGTSPKGYFCTFAYPFPSKHQLSASSGPKFEPKDYVLIVDVRFGGSEVGRRLRGTPTAAYKENDLLFSMAVPGETIPNFFAQGDTGEISLQHPILNFCEAQQARLEPNQHVLSQMQTFWKGTVHLLRLPDRKVIELVDVSRSCEWVHFPPRKFPEFVGYNDDESIRRRSLASDDKLGQIGTNWLVQQRFQA
ncbi:expressed unknown protein [Seminavis robusta]|uniref:Uncharacterized protein n=1 Tax=Seminavis robusta TaxID=568900 RepID=A0A9N8HEA5_9STRA|nr:expressed unknown protein [Seminavis robusta]|eukprot:Sro506_g156270.1 n/a (302) ;mRNA; r:10139-11044